MTNKGLIALTAEPFEDTDRLAECPGDARTDPIDLTQIVRVSLARISSFATARETASVKFER